MARYRKVDPRMWGDLKFRSLSHSAQRVWFYLLTCPESTSLPGLIPIGELGLAEKVGFTMEAFREAFAEVFLKGMAEADWKAGVVWLPRAGRYNRPESPNVVKSWRDHWDNIPECALKTKSYWSLKAFTEGLGEAYAKAFIKACGKALGKAMPNPEPEPEPDQEQEKAGAGAPDPPSPTKTPSSSNVDTAQWALETAYHHARLVEGKGRPPRWSTTAGATLYQQSLPEGQDGEQWGKYLRDMLSWAYGGACRDWKDRGGEVHEMWQVCGTPKDFLSKLQWIDEDKPERRPYQRSTMPPL